MTEVLHLIDSYRIGGPGKTILNSARFIDRTRFRVHVASFTHPDPSRNELADAARTAGIPYLHLAEEGATIRQHLSSIRDYVRRNRISILHTHGYLSDVLGFLAARRLPVAVVTTHHGWIRNNRRQRLAVRLATALTRFLDGIELVSETLRAELPASVRRSDKVAVVHNAIVLSDYVPQDRRQQIRGRLGVGRDECLLGVIGRLSVEKGCLEMLEAFEKIAQTFDYAHLVFVGEGPLCKELSERVRERGLQGRVHFAGHQAQVQPFYEASDIIVSPSRTEGLSNVLLEALAFERPVAATRVGGNAEIIEDGVSGLLVEPRSVSSIASAVSQLIRDERARERLGRNGRERVESHFTFEVRMGKEERFYDRILLARKPAAAVAIPDASRSSA